MPEPSIARKRLAPLLLEASMVVFAVLVALAVDEWREERQLAEQVSLARSAIETEVSSNRRELEVSLPTVQKLHDDVRRMAAALRADTGRVEWDVDARIPDFSDAAWETARSTGVMARMDYDWILRTARIYESQSVATQAQNGLFATLGSAIVRQPEIERVTDLQGQLFLLLQLYGDLSRKYAELLDSDTGPEDSGS